MVSFTFPWFPWHNPQGKKCPCAISSIRFQVLRPIMYLSERFRVGSQELRWDVLHTSKICWWLTADHPRRSTKSITGRGIHQWFLLGGWKRFLEFLSLWYNQGASSPPPHPFPFLAQDRRAFCRGKELGECRCSGSGAWWTTWWMSSKVASATLSAITAG